ncbi:MAG: DUF2817 domain-containing protein [bacterium]|nr:DUF2817 domain-containing protein [bacterium]
MYQKLLVYVASKKQRFLVFSFLSFSTLGFLLIFELFYLIPPQVLASAEKADKAIDGKITFSFLGSIDEENFEIEITPKTLFKSKWLHGLNPIQKQLVIVPDNLLKANTLYSVSLKIRWLGLKRNFSQSFRTGSLPKVESAYPGKNSKEVSSKAVLRFSMDKKITKGDFILLTKPEFDFEKAWVGKTLVVSPKTKLQQGTTYHTSLFLKTSPGSLELISFQDFTTLPSLEITSTDPKNNSKIVPKQSNLSFAFNKSLALKDFERLWKISPPTSGQFSLKNSKTVVFNPQANLKTNTNYSITLNEDLKADDGAYLDSDFNFKFHTAGPAKAIGFSPTGSGVSRGSSISVTFDQEVDHSSAQNHFSLSPATSGSFSWYKNTLSFHPSTNLKLFSSYKVVITKGIKSVGGENSTQSFSSSFTTTGERTKTIGYSVQGRAINATFFGFGSKKILLIGSMHGTEDNTGTMLSLWTNYLRYHQNQIPSDRTFIVVPFANPDGVSANSRFNARGVDLNRNWNADWQAQTYWKDKSYPHGGGSAPFSEPESRALRDLILSEDPVRTISYHSAASVVVGDGISSSFRNWYSSKTGYGTGSGGVETFGYAITGTMEQWNQNRGNITIVVEFATVTSSEYSTNFPALQALLTYPL